MARSRRWWQVGAALGAGVALGSAAQVLAPVAAPSTTAATVPAATVPADVDAAAQLDRDPVDAVGLGRRVRASVPELRVDGCGVQRQGSGVVVEANGVARLLTNAHVVVGADVALVDGGQQDVVGASRGRDAAVVSAPEGVPALVPGPEPAPGSVVVVVGHPGGRYRAVTGHVVAATRRSVGGAAADVLVTDVPVRGGSSGGAVLDGEGRVVGLVAARDAATGAAVAYPVGDVLSGPVDPAPPAC